MLVGAAEDSSKQSDPVLAKVKMDLAQLAGLNAIRVTLIWTPGIRTLDGNDLTMLQNSALAADLDGVRLFVSIYPMGSSVTPVTPQAQSDFVAYAASAAQQLPTVHDFIIGNEPNLNRFWMPQFGPRGSDAAATAYEALLAQTYDALKAVDPSIDVIGGAVSPRGGDDPRSGRQTHSPTTFIPDLGAAYRRSGRTQPIMDTFAFHPYMDTSRQDPSFQHVHGTTISINDYGKLMQLLGKAFDGTVQLGSRLPVLYDEFGVQTQVGVTKIVAYSNMAAVAARDAVPEATQALYYRKAISIAACQRNVIGLLLFHVSDEADLGAWQSGLFYADDTAKTSLALVRESALAAESGSPNCSG